MSTMSQRLSPEKVAEFNENCYGCDPDEFIEDIRDSITYKHMGKDVMIQSLLSDTQEMLQYSDKESVRKSLNRIKYLVRELA